MHFQPSPEGFSVKEPEESSVKEVVARSEEPTAEPGIMPAEIEPEVPPVIPPVEQETLPATEEEVVAEVSETPPEQPAETDRLPWEDPPGLAEEEVAVEEVTVEEATAESDEPTVVDEPVETAEAPVAETPAVDDVVDDVAEDVAEDDPFGGLFDDDVDADADADADADGSVKEQTARDEPEVEAAPPVVPEPEEPAAPARTALAVWQMSSKWSMAIALQAKGRNEDSFGERLEQAKYGARLLEVPLPELLTFEEDAERLTSNLMYMLDKAGPRLAESLEKRYGADHAALAELATKTHVLLLSYTPESTRLGPVIVAIRRAAESSGLPESVWRELIDLLESRAEFAQVKAAVFDLHRRATAALSGAN